jgi:hypothetical protein
LGFSAVFEEGESAFLFAVHFVQNHGVEAMGEWNDGMQFNCLVWLVFETQNYDFLESTISLRAKVHPGVAL